MSEALGVEQPGASHLSHSPHSRWRAARLTFDYLYTRFAALFPSVWRLFKRVSLWFMICNYVLTDHVTYIGGGCGYEFSEGTFVAGLGPILLWTLLFPRRGPA